MEKASKTYIGDDLHSFCSPLDEADSETMDKRRRSRAARYRPCGGASIEGVRRQADQTAVSER